MLKTYFRSSFKFYMLERTKRYLYEDRISQIKSPTNTCRLEYSGSYQRTKVIDVYSARSEVTVGVSQR